MARLVVFIASPIAPELVEEIRAVDPSRVEVIFEPDLLPKMRFQSDHAGEPVVHTPEQRRRWREHLGRADVLWDFPANDPDGSGGLAYAPKLRWIQGTSTGISHKILARGLQDSPIICTSARGVHGRQSAEFVFFALLMRAKNFSHLQAEQRAHRWTVYCTDELAGKTLAIVGAGHMGASVAALGKAFQMRVIAMARNNSPERAAAMGIAAFYSRPELRAMAAEADAFVVTVPHTPETEGMIDSGVFAAIKPGAVFVNVGRGKVVDEGALIQALKTGRVAFAGLDVFEEEPLPAGSPLWDMPNVLVSPHSSSIVPSLHAQVVKLFCRNLRCFLDGRPADMENLFDKQQLY